MDTKTAFATPKDGWACRISLWFVLVCVVLLALGCRQGHAARTAQARRALDAHNPRKALALLNEELGVDSADQLPSDSGGDTALLLLDRAMVLQQVDQYEQSSRDLQTADKQTELLDLARGATDDIAKYMFSDDAGPYRAPPYEKLMINTMNIGNYLVRGELGSARVEARRLAVMQKYLKDNEAHGASLTGLGSYLAGFTYEKSQRPQEALRHYDQALQYGSYPSLNKPIRRLARIASYRTPRLNQLLGEQHLAPTTPEEVRPAGPQSEPPVTEILVIVSYGRVPAKRAERAPIGLALTWAATHLHPSQHATAHRLAAQGLVTWINYPELGRSHGRFAIPRVALDGRLQSVEGILAVDLEAQKAWDKAKGSVAAAAITRMITRVVAGEAVRKASGEGVVGLLLGLGTQATLTAADTPDTRSWSTLPARVAIARLRVAPGTHYVDISVRGIFKRQQVTVSAGSFAVVNLTVLG